MNIAFDIIAKNIGSPFEIILVLILLFGGLIFYGRDVKVGLLTHLIGYAGMFIWFYQAGFNWSTPLILFLIFFVLLCLTLFTIAKSSPRGALI